MSYRVTEGRRLHGAMFGMRETLPIGGVAGGEPGAPTEFTIRRGGAAPEVLEAHATGVELAPGETFEFRAGSGGGWGDPLDRLPERVRRDVAVGRLSVDDAAAVYGVVLDEADDGRLQVDLVATAAQRSATRAARLRAAREPAVVPSADVVAAARALVPPIDSRPLYHGVVQRGRHAIAEASGAVLAVAPMHWTAGCPVLEAEKVSARGIAWHQRSYLDPISGRALYVEAVPVAAPRSFTTAPTRWAEA